MIVRSIVAFGSDFEQSGVSISWVIPFKTRLNWDIPGYPRLSFSPVQGYPVISHLVQSYPLKRYPRISRDIPRQDSRIGISHYKFSVLGYPGLSRINTRSGYPGISRDIPCGRFKFPDERVCVNHLPSPNHISSSCCFFSPNRPVTA